MNISCNSLAIVKQFLNFVEFFTRNNFQTRSIGCLLVLSCCATKRDKVIDAPLECRVLKSVFIVEQSLSFKVHEVAEDVTMF